MQKLIQYQLQLNVTENVLQTKLFSGFHNNCEKHWQGFKILNCGASVLRVWCRIAPSIYQRNLAAEHEKY